MVPVYNEARTVAEVLDRLVAIDLPVPREILVVNDGSTDGTREVLDRLAARPELRIVHAAQNGGKYPSMDHAGVYSAVLHYLKAVQAGKTDDGTKVIAQMKKMPTDDPLFGKGSIRKDGRKIHPAYLVEVKKPSESKGPWDYYKIRATIPADQAFRPEKDGGCFLVK